VTGPLRSQVAHPLMSAGPPHVCGMGDPERSLLPSRTREGLGVGKQPRTQPEIVKCP